MGIWVSAGSKFTTPVLEKPYVRGFGKGKTYPNFTVIRFEISTNRIGMMI